MSDGEQGMKEKTTHDLDAVLLAVVAFVDLAAAFLDRFGLGSWGLGLRRI